VALGDLGGGVALGLGQLLVLAGDLGEELRRQALVRAMAVVGQAIPTAAARSSHVACGTRAFPAQAGHPCPSWTLDGTVSHP
jgi:hypothetical protein